MTRRTAANSKQPEVHTTANDAAGAKIPTVDKLDPPGSNNSRQVSSTEQTTSQQSADKYPVGWKEKINTFLDLKQKGIFFNERLLESRAFKNPNIYRKLVEFIGLNERGSNDPNPLFGSHNPDFPYDALYDVRSQIQIDQTKGTASDQSNVQTSIAPAKSIVKDSSSSILKQDIFAKQRKSESKESFVSKRPRH